MYIYEIGALSFYQKNNCLEQGLTWRNQLDKWAKDNNIKTFNPALTFIKERNHSYNSNLCVEQNNFYINKCDIAIANMNEIDYSHGSIYELVRFKELGKPIIAFGAKHYSPHIQYCVSNWCDTLEDAIEVLLNMFNQNNFN